MSSSLAHETVGPSGAEKPSWGGKEGRCWIAIALFWGLAAWVVNPTGEFCVNDDWIYVRALQALMSDGSVIGTGWGKGGPSLITHLLWGGMFSGLFGFSLTTLRVSVVAAGVLSSSVLLGFLRFNGVKGRAAFVGTMTLVCNPLFFSQCFTYMTDITFACFASCAIAVLCVGAERSNTGLVVLGLLISLFAMLDRQLGLVIPLGFVLACCLHPSGEAIGRRRILLLALALTIIPWIAYEHFLQTVGSTPVTKFQGFENIFRGPMEMGVGRYLSHLFTRFFLCAISYTALFLSPILALQIGPSLRSKVFSRILLILAIAFVLLEMVILTGWADPPVGFQRNVIINFGIGPILLKDTYILKILRLTAIPTTLFYLLVFWAAISSLALGWRAVSFAKRFMAALRPFRKSSGDDAAPSFTALFAFLAGLIYLGVIMLTGFHDRYLIPLCLFFSLWLLLEGPTPPEKDFSPRRWPLLASLGFLVMLGAFSVAATHDFMETRRNVKAAHDFLLRDMGVEPCNVDGGFEFNGYHCCRRDPENDRLAGEGRLVEGRSWWWVAREDYVVTLGPMQDYRVIKTFPFERFLGKNGAVHVLQPVTEVAAESARTAGG